jgi:hypothetical protein
MPPGNEIEHSRQLGVCGDVVRRPVAVALDPLDLLDGQPEQEEVVRADLVAHLDVGPVQRTDPLIINFMLPVPAKDPRATVSVHRHAESARTKPVARGEG